jgi:hypothetical protein
MEYVCNKIKPTILGLIMGLFFIGMTGEAKAGCCAKETRGSGMPACEQCCNMKWQSKPMKRQKCYLNCQKGNCK